jgi:hypothetical protein
MIRFSCNCGNEFEVPADMAGGEIQCDNCGKLNDVPTLSDLQNIEDGGIFKVGEVTVTPPSTLLAEAQRAFTRDKQDGYGEDIDMRPDVEQFLKAGVDEIPLALDDDNLPGTPKYDPVTGELIETMPVRRDPAETQMPHPATIPVAKAAISYASGATAERVKAGAILVELIRPVNVFVMIFVLLLHVLLEFGLFGWIGGFFIIVPVDFILGMLIMAHYGCVIDETGPTEADELPRPLRNVSWSEDLWGPFSQVFAAVAVCFWPAMFWLSFPKDTPTVTMIGLSFVAAYCLCGAFFFPAVLLTTTTSGTFSNLEPARIISVIRGCRGNYITAVLICFVALAVYAAGMITVTGAILALFLTKYVAVPMMVGGFVATPLLLAGVYLAHFACWYLGKLYRAHHGRFNWLMQRHVRVKERKDAMFQLERRRTQQLIRQARARQRALAQQAEQAAVVDGVVMGTPVAPPPIPMAGLAPGIPVAQRADVLVDPSVESRRERMIQLKQQAEALKRRQAQQRKAQQQQVDDEEPPAPRYDLTPDA